MRRQVGIARVLGQLTPVPAEEQGLNLISWPGNRPAKGNGWKYLIMVSRFFGICLNWTALLCNGCERRRVFDGEASFALVSTEKSRCRRCSIPCWTPTGAGGAHQCRSHTPLFQAQHRFWAAKMLEGRTPSAT